MIEEGIVEMKVKLVNLGEISFPQFLMLAQAIFAYRNIVASVHSNSNFHPDNLNNLI